MWIRYDGCGHQLNLTNASSSLYTRVTFSSSWWHSFTFCSCWITLCEFSAPALTEQLSSFSLPPIASPDVLTCSQPQKKKKDRRKGKGGDKDENDDENIRLTLEKLSVQASDEEDEPGRCWSAVCVDQVWLQMISELWLCSNSHRPQQRKQEKGQSSVLTHIKSTCSLKVLTCCFCLPGRKHLCCSQSKPEWWRRWGGFWCSRGNCKTGIFVIHVVFCCLMLQLWVQCENLTQRCF